MLIYWNEEHEASVLLVETACNHIIGSIRGYSVDPVLPEGSADIDCESTVNMSITSIDQSKKSLTAFPLVRLPMPTRLLKVFIFAKINPHRPGPSLKILGGFGRKIFRYFVRIINYLAIRSWHGRGVRDGEASKKDDKGGEYFENEHD